MTENEQKIEFAKVLATMATAVGLYRAGNKDAVPKPVAAAYWELLHDLPLDVLKTACSEVLLEHKVSTLPTPGAIRQKAADLLCPLPSVDEAVQAVIAASRGQKLPEVYHDFVRTCIGSRSKVGMRKEQEAEDYVRFKWLAYVKGRRQEFVDPPRIAAAKKAIKERNSERGAITEKPRSQPKPQRRIEHRSTQQIVDATAVVKSATEPVERPQKTADEQLRELAQLQSKGETNE